MKILTAMYTLRKGGAYDRFIMMIEALLERGCEIHCLSLTPIQIRHPHYHNHLTMFPSRLIDTFVGKITVLILFPLYLLLIGIREKIDLFIAFGPLYAFLQAVPKLLLKKQMVTLIRLELSLSSEIQNIFDWLNKVVEFIALIFSDRIVTVSTSMKEAIEKIIKKRKKIELEVLFNNIPSLMCETHQDNLQDIIQKRIPTQAKIIATTGILTPRKNFETLLNCLPKIKVDNLILLIIGEGSKKSDFDYIDYLKREARNLEIDKKVIFTGWIDKKELCKVYKKVDVFLLTSLKEGMPNALLEALGSNVSCFGSNIPGIRDILYYDEIMFAPFDQQAIVKKIHRVLTDGKYSDYVNQLCQERKKTFIFDWKEKVFQMVTQKYLDRGEACQLK